MHPVSCTDTNHDVTDLVNYGIAKNPPFQLTPLIYAEEFTFENPTIMEDKQCKQMERFSAMVKGSDNILLMINRNKDIYKVKTNFIQRHDPCQIKKEEFSGGISKFPPVT